MKKSGPARLNRLLKNSKMQILARCGGLGMTKNEGLIGTTKVVPLLVALRRQSFLAASEVGL